MREHIEEQFPEILGSPSRRRRQDKQRRQAQQFVRGPLPMPWLERAARLPGKALAVGLLIWFVTGMKKEDGPIKLSTGLLRRFDIGRKASGRALTALQRAGLISAQRGRGRLPHVKILALRAALVDGGKP
jgi:hypothetical protein